GQTLFDRIIAVDFTVSKDEYESQKQEATESAPAVESDDDDDGVSIASSSTHSDEELDPKRDVPTKPNLGTKYNAQTVFVKNLLFETSEEDLQAKFSSFGKIRYIK